MENCLFVIERRKEGGHPVQGNHQHANGVRQTGSPGQAHVHTAENVANCGMEVQAREESPLREHTAQVVVQKSGCKKGEEEGKYYA